MKTPRQLLLQKHQSAESDLNEIRRRVVAGEFGSTRTGSDAAAAAPGGRLARAVQALWLELVWPCRQVWTGLAAVWVVICLLNHASAENPATNKAKAETLSPSMVMQLKEQRQLAADLEDLATAPAAESPQPRLRPRSEWTPSHSETV